MEKNKLCITTLHCNDRAIIFKTIQTFLKNTTYRDFKWYILAQGCSHEHIQQLKNTLKENGLEKDKEKDQFEIVVWETNLGWSRGMNELWRLTTSEKYEFRLHLEDDWILDTLSSSNCPKDNWLETLHQYMLEYPEVSTLFLRHYRSEEEKMKYAWKRSVPYRCFKYGNPFNYSSKMKSTRDDIEYYGGIRFQEIPEFLYTANPTLFRIRDYEDKGVFPFQEFKDGHNKREKWVMTQFSDAPEWGWAEALAMEKIRDLKCMNVDSGYFTHQ